MTQLYRPWHISRMNLAGVGTAYRFGAVDRGDRWKQLVGHIVRKVLERLGSRLNAQRVRIRRGDLFSSGSRYVLA